MAENRELIAFGNLQDSVRRRTACQRWHGREKRSPAARLWSC